MAVAIANTLEFLLGSWSIERVITDRHDGVEVSFSGVAVVARSDGGATYSETGEVNHGSHRGPARRVLLLTGLADGSVRLDFQDGRPFVDLDLAGGVHGATHPCRADTYEMTYEALDGDRIRECWRVSGPAKDYEAETIWRRL